MLTSLQRLIARVIKLRPVRVFLRYSDKNGPILAGGLSLTALYSVFAGLYVGFALLGLSIESNPDLKDAVVGTLSSSVPGLIDAGHGAAARSISTPCSSPGCWAGAASSLPPRSW